MSVSIYQFEEAPWEIMEHLAPRWAAMPDHSPTVLRVHSASQCGQLFRDVAVIIEHESSNPGLLCLGPIGLGGVKTILEMMERRQQARREEITDALSKMR